jgi:hypothetical protein
VFRSQPNLKIGKRAIPTEYLNDKSKDEAGDMKDLDSLILDSPNGSEEKKKDPKKMSQNHTICKNLVNHFSLRHSPHPIPLPTGERGRVRGLTNLYRGGRGSFLFGHLEQHDRRNDSDAP